MVKDYRVKHGVSSLVGVVTPLPTPGLSTMILKLVADRGNTVNRECAGEAVRRDDGDHATIEEMFLQHRVSLLRYLRRLVGCEQDALDLMQECFARLLNQADSGAKLTRGYLFTVALNLARDRGRRAVTRAEHAHQPLDDVELVDTQSTPYEEFVWNQALERLKAALSELPPRQRKIFLLRRFRHLSTGEIAELLNVSKRTVERELVATLEHCRGRMKDLLL